MLGAQQILDAVLAQVDKQIDSSVQFESQDVVTGAKYSGKDYMSVDQEKLIEHAEERKNKARQTLARVLVDMALDICPFCQSKHNHRCQSSGEPRVVTVNTRPDPL